MHYHGTHVEVDVFGRVQPARDVDVARLCVEREASQVYLTRRAELEAGQPVDLTIREDLDAEMVLDKCKIGAAVHPKTWTHLELSYLVMHCKIAICFVVTTGSDYA